jgi:hypothetical protein
MISDREPAKPYPYWDAALRLTFMPAAAWSSRTDFEGQSARGESKWTLQSLRRRMN